MAVLITGVAGFIGSNLAESLAGELEIIGIDNFDPFYERNIKTRNLSALLSDPNFTFIEADIRFPETLEKIEGHFDCIVHLAAKAGVRPSIKDPLSYAETNIAGTINVLEFARARKIPNIIFASSSSVYGNNKRVPFRETDSVDTPISPYAATKKSGELLCHTYSKLFGLNISALRFFTVYGRRQRPDLAIAKFTRLIDKGEPIPFYGDGRTERDYTYIDDIIDGIRKCINWTSVQPKGTYDVFNLGESSTIELSELVRCIEDSLGKKAQINILPAQPGDVRKTYADIRKAVKIFGYKPSTNIRDGIMQYVQYYQTANTSSCMVKM